MIMKMAIKNWTITKILLSKPLVLPDLLTTTSSAFFQSMLSSSARSIAGSMVSMMMNFPASVSAPVIPADSPTVPKADTVSKRI